MRCLLTLSDNRRTADCGLLDSGASGIDANNADVNSRREREGESAFLGFGVLGFNEEGARSSLLYPKQ